jgi:ATP-binding protein involved in chromosome partitioning
MAQDQPNPEHELKQRLAENLSRIKHKILVLSGKGGVGKSTIAAHLAATLASDQQRVGILDVDIHGPSIPSMFNLDGTTVQSDGTYLLPVPINPHLKVMSIGFFLEERDTPVIWRGPKKYSVIRQFLADVKWEELDYLVVDSPPGTGDEPLSIVQLLEEVTGAVIVTTPQQIALQDVQKGIRFCKELKVPVLGVVENMSGFMCPHCKKETAIFLAGGGETLAAQQHVPFLGKIPLNPALMEVAEKGTLLEEIENKSEIVIPLIDLVGQVKSQIQAQTE